MAKRFTDTRLGQKSWYRKMSPRLKCAWDFICRECESDGVWEIDEDAFLWFIGEPLSIQELLLAVNSDEEERLRLIPGNKIWVIGFIRFQYGELSESCKPHMKVISDLQKHGLWKEYSKGIETLEEEDKDKEEEKEGGVGEIKTPTPRLNFEPIYKNFPRKEGKQAGIQKCKAQIKSQEDFELLSKAVDRYAAHCRKEATELKFIKHFSTFMGCWRDWLDPETGKPPPGPPRVFGLKNPIPEDIPVTTEVFDLNNIFKTKAMP